jgi:hypothetical protein
MTEYCHTFYTRLLHVFTPKRRGDFLIIVVLVDPQRYSNTYVLIPFFSPQMDGLFLLGTIHLSTAAFCDVRLYWFCTYVQVMLALSYLPTMDSVTGKCQMHFKCGLCSASSIGQHVNVSPRGLLNGRPTQDLAEFHLVVYSEWGSIFQVEEHWPFLFSKRKCLFLLRVKHFLFSAFFSCYREIVNSSVCSFLIAYIWKW